MNGTYLEGISDPAGKVIKVLITSSIKTMATEHSPRSLNWLVFGGHQWSMAAGAIDIDKDGYQDLYVLNYGPMYFYHNNGNGTFQ